MGKRARGKPSDPAEVLRRRQVRRALEERAERVSCADPSTWGIDPTVARLPAHREVRAVKDPHREKVIYAKRSDAFSLVSLSAEQYAASRRYWKDWCERAGVRTHDTGPSVVIDNHPGLAPGQHVTQRMIDAGGRIEEAHARLGQLNARLLQGLVEPLVVHGQIRVWRILVQQITGETLPHAQAAAVRLACENLHLAYAAIDAERERARRDRRFAGGAVGAA